MLTPQFVVIAVNSSPYFTVAAFHMLFASIPSLP
jgi:hypothetical protein